MSEPSERQPQTSHTRHARIVRAAALGCLALALLCLWPGLPPFPHPGVSPARIAFAAGLGPIRPLRGRLTGGFEYRSLDLHVEIIDGMVHGYERPPAVDGSRMSDAARWVRRVNREYERHRTPQALADQAFLILLGQNPYRVETALPLLEEAVAENPWSAPLWSDLAAVYVANTKPPSRDLVAVAAADRALREEPTLLEARFNLALARKVRSAARDAPGLGVLPSSRCGLRMGR